MRIPARVGRDTTRELILGGGIQKGCVTRVVQPPQTRQRDLLPSQSVSEKDRPNPQTSQNA